MLRTLTDRPFCSFAHIVRVNDATNRRERIMGLYTFPLLRSMPFFLQENGCLSLKNVSKMYQRCTNINICIRPVPVLFWKISHALKTLFVDSKLRSRKGSGVCHAVCGPTSELKDVLQEQSVKTKRDRVSFSTRTQTSVKVIVTVCTSQFNMLDTHRGSSHPLSATLVRLTRPCLLACGRMYCSVLDSSCVDASTYLPTQGWIPQS